MRKVTCSVEGNLGILKNEIYDSQLEIGWLINEESHIKDPDSLHEVEQWTVEAANKLSARILALKIQQREHSHKAGRWNMLREHVFSLKAASVI